MTRAQMRADRIKLILDITKQLVLSNGIGASLMSEIAVQSGISRQRLYKYFSNIDDAIKALAVRSIDEMGAYLNEELQFFASLTPDQDALRQYIVSKLHALCNGPDEIHDNILYLTLYDVYMTKNQPDVHRDQQSIELVEVDKRVEVIVRNGQNKGTFRNDISSRYIMYWLNQTVLAYAYRYVLLKTDSKAGLLNNDEVFDWFADSVLRYLSQM